MKQLLRKLLWFLSPVSTRPLGLWYVRLTVNQPDGSYRLDSKMGQFWTSRDDLFAEYERRLGTIERMTPVEPAREPLDSVLYRYFDDEEEHAWRYFYILRLQAYEVEE
jgi:hypothetical protein